MTSQIQTLINNMVDKEAVEEERCNFAETLSAWELYNSQNSPESQIPAKVPPRRAMSAGNPPTAAAQTNASQQARTSAAAPKPVKQIIYDHPKKGNTKWQRRSKRLLVKAPRAPGPKVYRGKTVVRSHTGDSKIAETFYTLDARSISESLEFEKDEINPFAGKYGTSAGGQFNFDAIIYDLARIYALSSIFADDNALKQLSVLPNKVHYSTREWHQTVSVAEVKMSSTVHQLASLVQRQGGVITGDKQTRAELESLASSEEEPVPVLDCRKCLRNLSALYYQNNAFPMFQFAYIAGIHSAVKVGADASPSGAFFAAAMNKVKFGRPYGSMKLLFNESGTLNVTDALAFNMYPLNDLLQSAAFVTVSDPGDSRCQYWRPTIRFGGKDDFNTNMLAIMETSSKFFECWLENMCYFSLPRNIEVAKPEEESAFDIKEFTVSQFTNALRKISYNDDYNHFIAPWVFVEPTHLLRPTDVVYRFGGPMPLGPPDLSGNAVSAFENLKSSSYAEQKHTISFSSWTSLRKNMMLWLLTIEYQPFGHCLWNFSNYGHKTSLPTPLRMCNFSDGRESHISVEDSAQSTSLHFIDKDTQLDTVVYPLEVYDNPLPYKCDGFKVSQKMAPPVFYAGPKSESSPNSPVKNRKIVPQKEKEELKPERVRKEPETKISDPAAVAPSPKSEQKSEQKPEQKPEQEGTIQGKLNTEANTEVEIKVKMEEEEYEKVATPSASVDESESDAGVRDESPDSIESSVWLENENESESK